MNDCIFCKIVAGEIPSSKVYEDEFVLAFMNIKAVNEGHLLVIPKEHIPYINDMDDQIYTQLMLAVKKFSVAIERAFKPGRVGLAVSGWDVAHVHVHVVPMTQPNDLTSKKEIDNETLNLTIEQRDLHAEKIREHLSS